MDLEGVNIGKIFDSKFKKLIKITSKISQDYYPEMLHKMFIVNAPFIFQMVWAFVKNFLDKETQNKIFIKSGSGKKEIFKFIDKKNLPVFLKGESQIPLESEPGPW